MSSPLRLLTNPRLLLEHLKGERKLRLVSYSHNPEEAYTVHASNGGVIRIYCIETIYVITYARWWAKSKQHRTYRVYGICDDKIPAAFVDKLVKGIFIGNLLPDSATRVEQKQAAIQAAISMISSEIEDSHQQTNPVQK